MITRKIHYCWFGGRPLPLQAKRCLASWAYHLPDYEVVCWNEDNFDFNSHPFPAAAYKAKRYAFVADYVRMWALQNQGGIYMDTDVQVCGSFDKLLKNAFFIGLEDYKRFGTAVIGSKANHWLAEEMLNFYDETLFDENDLSNLVNVNEVSKLLLDHGFTGFGDEEEIDGDHVFAIGYFADAKNLAKGKIKPLARHLYSGSWRTKKKKNLIMIGWKHLRKTPEKISDLLHLAYYKLRVIYKGNSN